MKTVIGRRTFLLRAATFTGSGLALAACSGGGINFPATRQPITSTQQTTTTGSFGGGPVQVSLLLPLSATGNAGSTALALKNAAELALSETPNAAITMVPIDTKGTPEGAAAAARQAVSAGSRLIIGPLFSTEVAAAGQAAGSAGVPLIAFSSDPNAAGGNVRLLSFLAESDVNRIVYHAAQNGRRAFGALLPENAYGVLVENAMRQAVSRNGGQLIAVERYKADSASIQQASGRIAAIAAGSRARVNALLVPDGAAAMPFILDSLKAGGVDFSRVKLLGSGQWDDPAVLKLPDLAGGWFPAPNPAGFNALSAKYRGRYGTVPPRIASLAYDASSLAAALARIDPANPYAASRLNNPDGFQGTDGIFRFERSGRNERGLAVLEVQPPGSRIVQQAPTTFRSAGF